MFYAIAFSFFAIALTYLAVQHRGLAFALLWPAISFFVVALAYAGLGPRVFAKTPHGRRAAWATMILLPYLAISWLLWSLRRLILRDPCGQLIAPGIWLGRRPYRHELPERVGCIVDLACEFTAAKEITTRGRYISLPVLDTATPSPAALIAAVKEVAGCSDVIYVHCAAGHGRSAMFVAALLIARSIASNPHEAQQIIKAQRPAIRLSRQQLHLLEQIQEELRASHSATRQ